MTKAEIVKAERRLRPYVDRCERAGLDKGGWCLTAYWSGAGGQKIFYALDQVDDRVHEIEESQTLLAGPNPDYLLRNIPVALWCETKERAALDAMSVRMLILQAIADRLAHK